MGPEMTMEELISEQDLTELGRGVSCTLGTAVRRCRGPKAPHTGSPGTAEPTGTGSSARAGSEKFRKPADPGDLLPWGRTSLFPWKVVSSLFLLNVLRRERGGRAEAREVSTPRNRSHG